MNKTEKEMIKNDKSINYLFIIAILGNTFFIIIIIKNVRIRFLSKRKKIKEIPEKYVK